MCMYMVCVYVWCVCVHGICVCVMCVYVGCVYVGCVYVGCVCVYMWQGCVCALCVCTWCGMGNIKNQIQPKAPWLSRKERQDSLGTKAGVFSMSPVRKGSLWFWADLLPWDGTKMHHKQSRRAAYTRNFAVWLSGRGGPCDPTQSYLSVPGRRHPQYSTLQVTNAIYCCSVAQSCQTLCNPVDCRPPGFPVLHCLLELAQIHVHWVAFLRGFLCGHLRVDGIWCLNGVLLITMFH